MTPPVYRRMNSQDSPDAHFNAATVLHAQRRLAEALAAYDLALARQPGFATAWNNRGVVLREIGRYDDAIASIGRAIAASPGYAQAFFNRATVAGLNMKNYPAAMADLRHAMSLAPNMPFARIAAALHDACRVTWDLARASPR